MPLKVTSLRLAISAALFAGTLATHAADVTVQPAAGSGFVVKDSTGANERLRVQESGAVTLPGVPGATAQTTNLCMSSAGLLGPCSTSGSGQTYTAGAGLVLNSGAFSVAPTYQLPQSCTANQIAQWNGTAWACGVAGGGGTLPAGTVNQTLRYDSTNTPVANGELQVFADGGVLATDAAVNAALAGNTTPPGAIPASGAGARMMWYPAKAAFRAGYVSGTAWDDANVGFYSTAMGLDTMASGNYSTAMGIETTASGDSSTAIGVSTKAIGGSSTAMGNSATASGYYSIAIGNGATASGAESTAMGYETTASGTNSTAMGDYASTTDPGSSTTYHVDSFVYGDGTSMTNSTADRQFMVRASGGFVFYTASSNTGVQLSSGAGSWTSLSDRNSKTAVVPIDARAVLDKIAAMPLNTWQYKTQEAKYRHMGPMAQDFYAAFHLGETDRGIDDIDAQGVALAAIQGLNAKLEEKDAEIAALHAEISSQEERLAALESTWLDIADIKRQLAALRRPVPTAGRIEVAWKP